MPTLQSRLSVYHDSEYILRSASISFSPNEYVALSTALAHLSDSKLPKDEALRLLRAEMQRCLGSLKGKRQKISQLHEDLQLCQGRVNELQTQLDEAKLSSSVRTKLDTSEKIIGLCAGIHCLLASPPE